MLNENISTALLDPRVSQRIDEKRRRIDALRPLNPQQVAKLREQLHIELTYNSNAIEGNRLTLHETFLVLQEGITIKNKPLKDHLEARDHKEALDFLDELVNAKRVTMSALLIRQLHQLVVRETDREWAGRYRVGAVMITGAAHQPPDAHAVEQEMNQLIGWFSAARRKLHPVELAARVHHRLVHVHPFFDGNGRTARLLMNLTLMRHGFPMAVVQKVDRRRYYRVLQQADTGNAAPLCRFIAQAVERSLDLYVHTFDLRGSQESQLTLAEASQHTRYSAKYLNLLARSGRLAASKKGRNWYTTLGAIERYQRERLRKR